MGFPAISGPSQGSFSFGNTTQPSSTQFPSATAPFSSPSPFANSFGSSTQQSGPGSFNSAPFTFGNTAGATPVATAFNPSSFQMTTPNSAEAGGANNPFDPKSSSDRKIVKGRLRNNK